MQNEAIDNIVASVNDALVCIANHKLESEFSPRSLELFLEGLMNRKEGQKDITSDSPSNAQKQQENDNNEKTVPTVSMPTESCSNGLDFGSASDDPADAMVVILAHMDANSLQLILRENFKDQDLRPFGDNMNKVAMIQSLAGGKVDFIRSASDPAKLVLDVLRGCYYSNLKEVKNAWVVVGKSFLTVLEKLLIISPEINPCVKAAATKFAVDWKAQLPQSRSQSFEVYGFLHLLAIYKIGSSFDADELLGLFHYVSDRRRAPELFRLLNLARKASGTQAMSYYILLKFPFLSEF